MRRDCQGSRYFQNKKKRGGERSGDPSCRWDAEFITGSRAVNFHLDGSEVDVSGYRYEHTPPELVYDGTAVKTELRTAFFFFYDGRSFAR